MTKALYVFIIAITVAFFGIGLADTEASWMLVTNTNDSGAGSLRQAILDSNATPDPSNTIYFEEVSGTITLTSGELLISRSVSIIGPGAGTLTVNGNATFRVFHIQALPDPVSALISDLTITGGNGCNGICGWGGGVLAENDTTLMLRNAVVAANSAGTGGGIAAPYSTLHLINSTVRDNIIPTSGSAYGGGIYAKYITIENSTISGNSGGTGGGISVGSGQLTLINSTVRGNSGFQGGGIYATYSDAVLKNVTISDNTASSDFAGMEIVSGSPNLLSVTNTILSHNTVDTSTVNCGYNANITLVSGGGNIEDAGGCELTAATDRQNTNPELGLFQDNGGLTMTYAPLLIPLSPAIDGGVNAGAPSTDQRGWPRPYNSVVDSGAVEFMLPSLLTVNKAGHGRVLSLPPGIDAGISASSELKYFPNGKKVSLTAIASGLSVFSGWSGTGCGDSVLMSTSKTCTATFTSCGTADPVQLGPTTYGTIFGAFVHINALYQDIRVTASNRIGDFTLYTNTYTTRLHGGYDCGFANQIGYTYLTGTVTISGVDGGVEVDNIIIL